MRVVPTLQIFSAYFCVPLRLGGEYGVNGLTAESQSNAEIYRVQIRAPQK